MASSTSTPKSCATSSANSDGAAWPPREGQTSSAIAGPTNRGEWSVGLMDGDGGCALMYGSGVIWVEAFWQVVSVLTDAGPTGLLVGTGAVAGVLLIAVLAAGVVLSRRATSVNPGIIHRAWRERLERTG